MSRETAAWFRHLGGCCDRRCSRFGADSRRAAEPKMVIEGGRAERSGRRGVRMARGVRSAHVTTGSKPLPLPGPSASGSFRIARSGGLVRLVDVDRYEDRFELAAGALIEGTTEPLRPELPLDASEQPPPMISQ